MVTLILTLADLRPLQDGQHRTSYRLHTLGPASGEISLLLRAPSYPLF